MELNDLQIRKGLKRKDTDVYAYIIERYAKQVYYVAYQIMRGAGTKEDVEECAADVFHKAWSDAGKFNPDKGEFKTWLLMLAKYVALEARRKLQKVKTVDISGLQITGDGDVAEIICGDEATEEVIKIIESFGATDRELFTRRYFGGEPINEIAASLQLTRSAADNRLLRGRKIIKEALNHE